MQPVYKLQRFRGGFAICEYRNGQRISRRQLESRDATSAADEYNRIVLELKKPKDPTVAEIWELYRADREGRKIAVTMKWTGVAVLKFFGTKKPSNITIQHCRDYVTARREDGVKDGTIYTELGHLRIVLKWAENREIIAKAPAIERPPAPPPKERHLTRDEFDRLLAGAEMPHIKLFLLLAVGTAGRAEALLELTWDRVDFERQVIDLKKGIHLVGGQYRKGRAAVPITKTLIAALTEAKKGARTDYVIEWTGEAVKSVKKGIKSAARRSGIDGVSPHVLRHTAAVWMAEDRVPMTEIAQYLGHKDSRTTERVYARFSPDYLRKAAGALEIKNAVRSV